MLFSPSSQSPLSQCAFASSSTIRTASSLLEEKHPRWDRDSDFSDFCCRTSDWTPLPTTPARISISRYASSDPGGGSLLSQNLKKSLLTSPRSFSPFFSSTRYMLLFGGESSRLLI